MTSRISPQQKKVNMNDAISVLSKYFGTGTTADLINRLDFVNTTVTANGDNGLVQPSATRTPEGAAQDNSIENKIMTTLFDDSQGAYTTKDLLSVLSQARIDGQLLEDFKSIVKIYCHVEGNYENFISGDVNNMITAPNAPVQANRNGDRAATQTTSPAEATQNTPSPNDKLSAFLVNTGRISFSQRNNNIITLFANSIPNIELNKIQPYLEVTFNTPRTPVVTQNNVETINGMSLVKFINGAQQLNQSTSVTRALVMANQTSRPTTGAGSNARAQASETNSNAITPDAYTAAGMEMFTSPQSLVNGDYTDNPTLHSQKILDKFQPFMSLEGVDLNIVGTHGLMSNKTGTMKLKLHDRSRLADIAEFIRPEYYGANEIILEYGWYHPDGEILVAENGRNPYGDLLNGMRLKEKYQILNSSFSMTDNGEVTIELRISMKGANDFETESILTDDSTISNSMRAIQDLQSTIIDLRRAIFGENNANFGSREIRGTQILDAAGDGVNHLLLTQELRTALDQMKTFLRGLRASTQRANNVEALISALDSYEANVENAQKALLDLLRGKISILVNGPDPIKESALNKLGIQLGRNNNSNLDDRISFSGQQSANFTRLLQSIGYSGDQQRINGCFSLAKLLLLFVGVPLSKNYEDVQFYFYPFNANAALANRINTGEFIINADLFIINFMRWRLQTLGQTTNINLREFLQWLASTFFDDPVSDVYGLKNGNNRLYRRVFTEENGIGVEPAIPRRGNEQQRETSFMTSLNETLEQLTPNGEFRVPQIEFYIETLPAKNIANANNIDPLKSILKIHVFDRLNNPFESVQQINKSLRNDTLSSIGRIIAENRTAREQVETTATPGESRQDRASRETRAREAEETIKRTAQEYNRHIQTALDQGIIELIPNTKPARYRMAGGAQSAKRLKEFFYQTTPYLIYGSAGSIIQTANLSSLQDSRLTTVNLLRNHSASPLEPNGENPGGLPMQVIPAQLEITMLGCPFFNVGQTFFVDFNTGTTIDNFYSVVRASYNIGPGTFETRVSLAPTDGYGQYINILNQIGNFRAELNSTQGQQQQQQAGLSRAQTATLQSKNETVAAAIAAKTSTVTQ